MSELRLIDRAATRGFTNPKMARGTAIRLYNKEKPKFSLTALKVRLESIKAS